MRAFFWPERTFVVGHRGSFIPRTIWASGVAAFVWGAQAASLQVSAACRDGKRRPLGIDCAKMLPAGLPATTGWQPVLPRKRDARCPNPRAFASLADAPCNILRHHVRRENPGLDRSAP